MEELSLKLKQQRGNRGIRAVASEIGIGHATLSRIESGKQPDLDTFIKICKWLKIDPNSILGFRKKQSTENEAMPIAHFRAEKTMSTTTATHLADLIVAVQKAALDKNS